MASLSADVGFDPTTPVLAGDAPRLRPSRPGFENLTALSSSGRSVCRRRRTARRCAPAHVAVPATVQAADSRRVLFTCRVDRAARHADRARLELAVLRVLAVDRRTATPTSPPPASATSSKSSSGPSARAICDGDGAVAIDELTSASRSRSGAFAGAPVRASPRRSAARRRRGRRHRRGNERRRRLPTAALPR